jgi:Family of unknown function (DUF5681)
MTKRRNLEAPPDPAADYEVGYRKPPEHTRFQKGQSGNSMGRPKGSRNKIPDMKDERLKGIILEEAYRDIRVRDGERSVTLPVIRAAVRTLANKGLKGETRSLKGFMALVQEVENERTGSWRDYLKTMIEYKYDWEQELHRRERDGITHLPDPILHPDDVVVDLNTGDVTVKAAMTREEMPKWEAARQETEALGEVIEQLKTLAKADPDNEAIPRTIARLQARYDQHFEFFGPVRETDKI